MIKIDNLTKRYGETTAIDDISIIVPEGSVCALVGPNGAGKSTLLKILCKIIGFDSGTVTLSKQYSLEEFRQFMAYLPEQRGLYGGIDIITQLHYFAAIRGISKRERKKNADYWLDRFDIAGWKNRRISELSKGMQQKVQLVCCLISMPKLIFLDEPFSGIDPINFNLFTEIIKEYNKESGATIVLSTHNMKSVESICSEVAFMKEGKICTNGNIANVRKQFMRDHYYEIILSKSDGIRDGEVDWAMALGDSFRVDYVEYGYERVRLGVFAQNGTDAVETITELVKRMQGYDVIACGRNAPSMEEIFLQIGK